MQAASTALKFKFRVRRPGSCLFLPRGSFGRDNSTAATDYHFSKKESYLGGDGGDGALSGLGGMSASKLQPSGSPQHQNSGAIDGDTLLDYAVKHRKRVFALLGGELYKDTNHPIYNFLFKYYSFNKVKLFSYSPGMNIRIKNFSNDYFRSYYPRNDVETDGKQRSNVGQHDSNLGPLIFHSPPHPPSSQPSHIDVSHTSPHPYSYVDCVFRDEDINQLMSERDLVIRPKQFTKNQLHGLTAARDILKSSYGRMPNYACYGLHEWAMVYKPTSELGNEENKASKEQESFNEGGRNYHQGNLKLRLSEFEIGAFVESRSLRCTHFDAYRFFSAAAIPLNATQLKGYPEKVGFEQPGCLHVHMDLFKWALKLFPYVSSELIANTLEIALLSREVDMRASPYDLTSYKHADAMVEGLGKGFGGHAFDPSPIYIETAQGRKAYQRHQEWLYKLSQPIRLELLAAYETVLSYAQTCQSSSPSGMS